jgi:hypothetical protein
MTRTPQAWLLMALVGCRGSTSAPRRTSASPPVATRASAASPGPPSDPPDAGEVVFRGNLRYVSACLAECHRIYVLCNDNTLECDELERLRVTLLDAASGDAAANDALASTVMAAMMSERTGVCVARCDEPRRVCARRCFTAVDDAGRPLR